MRMVSSFLVSVAFHAAVLALPAVSVEKGGAGIIPVVLLIEGKDQGIKAARKGGGAREARKSRRGRIERQEAEADGPKRPEPILTDSAPKKSEAPAQQARVSEALSWSDEAGLDAEEGGGAASVDPGRGSAGGEISEAGRGPEGEAKREPPAEIVFARAGYAYTPKPDYPDRARREGWEGTVLLAVLVDRQGRCKAVEVSRSSGFALLDRAAAEAVRLWRFHPAREGETKVESWVKIPIVFRLD